MDPKHNKLRLHFDGSASGECDLVFKSRGFQPRLYYPESYSLRYVCLKPAVFLNTRSLSAYLRTSTPPPFAVDDSK